MPTAYDRVSREGMLLVLPTVWGLRKIWVALQPGFARASKRSRSSPGPKKHSTSTRLLGCCGKGLRLSSYVNLCILVCGLGCRWKGDAVRIAKTRLLHATASARLKNATRAAALLAGGSQRLTTESASDGSRSRLAASLARRQAGE